MVISPHKGLKYPIVGSLSPNTRFCEAQMKNYGIAMVIKNSIIAFWFSCGGKTKESKKGDSPCLESH